MLLLAVLPAKAAEICGLPAAQPAVLAALARIQLSVDPCGESDQIGALLDKFRRCAVRGYRVCLNQDAERNYIEPGSRIDESVPTTITWNPSLDTVLETGCHGDSTFPVRRDATASLLHEVVHAVQHCEGLDPTEHEFDALRIENIYRRGQGLCQRAKYGDLPLPATMIVTCEPGECRCAVAEDALKQVRAPVASSGTVAADAANR